MDYNQHVNKVFSHRYHEHALQPHFKVFVGSELPQYDFLLSNTSVTFPIGDEVGSTQSVTITGIIDRLIEGAEGLLISIEPDTNETPLYVANGEQPGATYDLLLLIGDEDTDQSQLEKN